MGGLRAPLFFVYFGGAYGFACGACGMWGVLDSAPMINRFFVLFCLFAVGMLVSSLSYADEKYWRATVQSVAGWGKTGPEACTSAAVNASSPTTTYRFHSYQVQTATTGRCAVWNATNTGGVYNGGATEYVCSGSTPFFSYKLFKCVATPDVDDKPCQDKNPFIRRFNYGATGGPFPAPAYYDNCAVEPVEMLVCRKDILTGHSYCMWTVKRTGVLYEGAVDPIKGGEDKPEVKTEPQVTSPQINPPTGGRCPAGTVQAGSSSDGVPICMGTGTAPKNSQPPAPKTEVTKTEALPDGSTKTTVTTTTKNSDGSTTVTNNVTTIAPDGSKTTAVDKATGTNSAGKDGTDDSGKDDEKFDLCKQNPTLTICRNSAVAGRCGEISCEGDAIMCATLRAASAMECRQIEERDKLDALPQTSLGKSILSGADPMQGAIDGALKGAEVDLSPSALSDAAFLSSAVCLADRSFAVGDRTITVSFARLCPALLPLRYAVLACAWIVAYLIVSRSILNG